jgi:hypothetical protein
MYAFIPSAGVIYGLVLIQIIYIKMFVKRACICSQIKKIQKAAQIGTNVRALLFNARLMTESQFASGMSCDSRFSVILEQMLSWHPNSTLHCMLHMQSSEW